MTFRRILGRFRPEEVFSLALFLPMAYALAHVSAAPAAVPGAAAGYPGSLPRLIALLIAAAFFLWLVRYRPQWELLRDAMPFVFCVNVYANLYDLIRFYGAPDITPLLYRWDILMFGVEPTIWAEQFIHPFLTDFFTFCYWLFYVCGPVLGLVLYLKKEWKPFRYTMVSVVLCLFMGYIGYVAWPATAPRLAIPEMYTVPLHGWSPFLDYSRAATAAVPLTVYGAFPSLHCAIALLALLLAWKHLRWFFWIQLPFGLGLILGTVYLRHHWVVDILAGFALTLLAFWIGPKLEDAWERWREEEKAALKSPTSRSRERSGPPPSVEDRAIAGGS